MLQPMDDMILRPKRQAIVDRLRRRLDQYRQRHGECVPRFDQSFSGSCEQQNLETGQLQKRFLEGKAKRQAKKSDRKPDLPAISGNLHSSVHVQQKFGCGDYEPPAKLQCGGGEALTKFSVEIVQQLEFTTSAADSQPQQISTNVTVKTHANPIKTSNSPPPPRAPTPLDLERECKAECKSEVADDELVSLDECAAALEREPAFPGLAELIGDTDDGSGGFGLFMTDISDDSDFINFDLDGGGKGSGLGEEEGSRGYGGGGEMSPAAQTLKHMAEQHQQATGADWARYRPGYGGYRPRAPPPAAPHPAADLHMSQHQQLHISHPHHNIQVSAAQQQHMGGGAAHAAAGMFASYQHQPAAPTMHHQGETYSVSQSQSISLQAMRQRSQPPAPQQPLGVAAVGLSREHQAKMLQQQQQSMLRAQQHMRPPPPEYKPRYRPAGGPGGGGGAGPAGGGQGAWRHLLLQQHPPRHHFPHHHQGYNNMGGMTQQQQQQMQLQQARLQQQQQQLLHQQQQQQHQQQQQQQQQQQHQQQQQRNSNQHSSLSHLLMQQNQVMNVQGQMPGVHMSQSQSMSVGSGGFQGGAGGFPGGSGGFPGGAGGFPGGAHDFSLDFLDSMPASDAAALTAQELLNVLDNSFLNDIL